MSRWKHEAGDCWPDRCPYCAEEIADARTPTAEELADMRAAIRAGGRPVPRTPNPVTLTDTESAARARARLEKEGRS